MSKAKVNCVAYYLGQFHPTEENNQFWGPGFTEWHNVSKARRLFPGHVQPKLPGRLGFYDLRCRETLVEQYELAKTIGIDFCFWHYWFAGKRLLYRPLDSMLALDLPEFKFMLGWANESWSGIWHGAADRILVPQSYDESEVKQHALLLSQYVDTGKYLCLDGRFPFVVYKPKQIPHAAEYLGQLKELVRQFSGAELYVIGNWSPGPSASFSEPSRFGLDAAVITPVAAAFSLPGAQLVYSGVWQVLRALRLGPEIRRYASVSSALEAGLKTVNGIAHATIVTGWDTTPRCGRRGLVLAGYTKEAFTRAANHALSLEKMNKTPLLFIKSWNEWAEGNVLEPVFNQQWSTSDIVAEVLGAE